MEQTKKRTLNKKPIMVFVKIVGAIVVVGLLIMIPFYVHWCGLKGKGFQTFVSVYSALIGGGLTLVGVAWTIKHEGNVRAEEEKKKLKPVFVLNKLYVDPKVGACNKFCFDGIKDFKEYRTTVTAEVENSNKSILSIVKIYHDERWWDVEGDTILLPGQKGILSFVFNEDADNLFLQIEDERGNKYYYEISVLTAFLMINPDTNQEIENEHTVKKIKEVDLEEIKKRIAKNN